MRSAVIRRADAALVLTVAGFLIAATVGIGGEAAADPPPSLVERARTLHAEGQLDAAVGVLRQQLAADAQDPTARYLLSVLLLELNRAEEAVRELRTLDRLHPGNRAARSQLASAYEASGEPERAAALLESIWATEHAAQRLANQRLERLLGELLNDQLGEWLHQPINQTLYELVGLYERMDRPVELAATLDRIVAVRQHDWVTWLQLAELREALGNPVDALKAYQWLAWLTPTKLDVIHAVGRLQIQLEKDELALQTFEGALRVKPDDAATLEALARIYGWFDRTHDRVRSLRSLLEVAPRNVEARLQLAISLSELDKPRLAAAQLEQAVALRPYEIDLRVWLARLYEEADRYDDAIRQLEAILLIDPLHVGALRALARVYDDRGERRRALALYWQLKGLDASDADLMRTFEELELELQPRLSFQYDFFLSRLDQTRHAAQVRFDHEPVGLIRYWVGYRYGYNEGESRRRAPLRYELQSHGGFAGVSFRVLPRTSMELQLEADGYVDADAFFGGHVAISHRFRFPMTAELRVARRENFSTIDAVQARTTSWDVSGELSWEPLSRWLVAVDGGYGFYQHTDDTTQGLVDNHQAHWRVGTGVRAVEEPVILEVLADYTGETFETASEGSSTIPYFAPELEQTIGLSAFLEHRPSRMFRYAVFARPHWIFGDAALQITYSAEVEVKLHPKHILQLRYERTDTLAGDTDVIYNENVLMAHYTWVF